MARAPMNYKRATFFLDLLERRGFTLPERDRLLGNWSIFIDFLRDVLASKAVLVLKGRERRALRAIIRWGVRHCKELPPNKEGCLSWSSFQPMPW